VPRHGGHPDGDVTWSRLFLACELGAFAAYVGGLLLLGRAGERIRRSGAVVALAVAIQLTPLAAPLLLSTDAWTYWDYGRIAVVHGGNPYEDTPADFPDDPAYAYVGTAWRASTSVYGPAFTLASEPLARAAGTSADAAAWIFKTLAAAAAVGCALAAARLSPRPAFAAAFVGWNPLLAIHFAGGGHNDAWMAVLVLAALVAAAAGRPRLAGAAWALSALVKWVSLLLLPLRALEARATGRRVSHVGFATAAALVLGLATWRYGLAWAHAFGPLARNANHETSFALPHRVQQLGVPRAVALGLAATVFAGGYAWLAVQARRGRARLGLATGLLLVTTPYLAPWYAIWAVPLAAAEDDRTAQWLSVALCAYLLRQTVPL
jgi:alpha-1,6-mannosyltransferase